MPNSKVHLNLQWMISALFKSHMRSLGYHLFVIVPIHLPTKHLPVLSINHSLIVKLITLFPAVLLLAACSPKSDHLAAISCDQQHDVVMRSSMNGEEKNDDKKYSEVYHYLLNYETGQVKRWIDKEGAPLVTQVGVRFEPDFISWNFYVDPISNPHTIEKNSLRLNRETLTIDGGFQMKDFVSGIGGYFQIITVSGQCKKTEIPWEKLKSKQI